MSKPDKYKGWHLRAVNDRGLVGVVVWREGSWQFTGWGFGTHAEALQWGREQIEDVFLGRVK